MHTRVKFDDTCPPIRAERLSRAAQLALNLHHVRTKAMIVQRLWPAVLAVALVAQTRLVSTQDESTSTRDVLEVLWCGFSEQPMSCARERTARLIDSLEDRLDDEMKSWGDEADNEVLLSGRQLSDMPEPPSVIGHKLMTAINELTNILQKSLYRFQARKKGDGGGIDSITISTSQNDDKKKKEKKKKKKKPSNVHIHHNEMQQQQEQEDDDKGLAVHREQQELVIQGLRVDQELVGPPKIRIKREQVSAEVGDGRGKKKKKKAILKLLLLGAVLKAKIGLLLQLFSAHLQVKFFAIALAGLALNIARFWLDLKKGHTPQKVIYYEHAQHQHHYDHEDDHGWGGYWSRSIADKPIHKQDEPIQTSEDGNDLAFGGWLGRSRSQTRRK